MARNQQRLSQLITAFGPGAMLDLPTRSVLVDGLEWWDMRDKAFKPIVEPGGAALPMYPWGPRCCTTFLTR